MKSSLKNLTKFLSNNYFLYTVLPLFFVFSLGLFLRLFGINHGYPFIFHPDEATIIRSALGIRFDINPDHFDWPHFYIYLNFFYYMAFVLVRKLFSPEIFSFLYNDAWIFYLLTRIFTAFLSSFTVLSIYLTAKSLFSNKVGILSALAMSIVPFHIWHSHYALSDAPMVFLLSLALYFSSQIITKNNLKSYILAGLFIGLSASTKYNGGLSALMVPFATLIFLLEQNLIKRKSRIFNFNSFLSNYLSITNIKNWFFSGLAAFFGFVLGTPFALLDYETFSRTDGPSGAFWQFKNVGSVDLLTHFVQFFEDMFYKLSNDFGYTLFIGFIFAFVISIYSLKKKIYENNLRILFLSLMGLFLLWYISGFEKSRSHYYMISYPFIVVTAGYFFSLFDKFRNIFLRYIFYIIFYLIPFVVSFSSIYTFGNGDTRVDLYNWLSNRSDITSIVYDFNDLDIVLNKISSVKGYNGFNNLSKLKTGYVIITSEDDYFDSRYTLNLVESFDNKNKRGPEIKVYTFSR